VAPALHPKAMCSLLKVARRRHDPRDAIWKRESTATAPKVSIRRPRFRAQRRSMAINGLGRSAASWTCWRIRYGLRPTTQIPTRTVGKLRCVQTLRGAV